MSKCVQYLLICLFLALSTSLSFANNTSVDIELVKPPPGWHWDSQRYYRLPYTFIPNYYPPFMWAAGIKPGEYSCLAVDMPKFFDQRENGGAGVWFYAASGSTLDEAAYRALYLCGDTSQNDQGDSWCDIPYNPFAGFSYCQKNY
jgi:hypothetical protein